MLTFLTDENFDRRILRGLRRRHPGLDIVRVQDVGLSGADDPAVLEWAADQGRVVLTHDASTMASFAWERVDAGLPMPGLVEVKRALPLGSAIEDLVLIATCCDPDDLADDVTYLPL